MSREKKENAGTRRNLGWALSPVRTSVVGYMTAASTSVKNLAIHRTCRLLTALLPLIWFPAVPVGRPDSPRWMSSLARSVRIPSPTARRAVTRCWSVAMLAQRNAIPAHAHHVFLQRRSHACVEELLRNPSAIRARRNHRHVCACARLP